jgi:hypothetical protein
MMKFNGYSVKEVRKQRVFMFIFFFVKFDLIVLFFFEKSGKLRQQICKSEKIVMLACIQNSAGPPCMLQLFSYDFAARFKPSPFLNNKIPNASRVLQSFGEDLLTVIRPENQQQVCTTIDDERLFHIQSNLSVEETLPTKEDLLTVSRSSSAPRKGILKRGGKYDVSTTLNTNNKNSPFIQTSINQRRRRTFN